ncbi:MAG: ribonuclease P protein component [Bacteroidales bacterium]|jgi:ribonuclease P protein component|nr:ribonuclease P protein component [Bacteroidales bacterium]MDD3161968.1 ribonuclease P protein component [Bacteroidales bacterium]
MNPTNGFCKEERLCGKTSIDTLFQKGKGFIVYPFRVVWLTVPKKGDFPCELLISVPKRKFKRANKRNRIKRYIREAYRLNKGILYQTLEKKEYNLDLALLYLDNTILESPEFDARMKTIFNNLAERLP